MFSFGYDKNGNKDGVYIYDLSNTPKLTEFYFNEKGRSDKYKSSISIIEFNEENLIKFTGFFYHNSNLKNIDNIVQYDFSANEKKEIVWGLPQNTGNVAVYLDNDPEYEKKTQEFFEKRKKWIKEIKE